MALTPKENKIVLDYKDSLLRVSDVQLLKGPYWLNDTVIGFYFEYLNNTAGSKLLFVSPELTQLLKLSDISDCKVFLDSVDARRRDFVFFPLNDCKSRNDAGGTHWSLVVYSRLGKKAFHFDSARGLNCSVASDFSRKILDSLVDEGSGEFVEFQDCPSQDNGYDCGLYVLCITDAITQSVAKCANLDNVRLDGVKKMVSGKREELLKLIDQLKRIE